MECHGIPWNAMDVMLFSNLAENQSPTSRKKYLAIMFQLVKLGNFGMLNITQNHSQYTKEVASGHTSNKFRSVLRESYLVIITANS